MKKRHLALGATSAVGAAIAWKFLTRKAEVRWEQVADRIHHADNSKFAEVDGTRIHYQEFGEKNNPTIIMLHGYSSSTHTWRETAPRLAKRGFHVLAVDMVGFGYSDKPAWFDYTITSQARMISRFMDRLGIGRATVAGSSYGGTVASTLTLDYPERVEKLILIGSPCNDEPLKHPVARLAKVPGLGEVTTAFLVDSKAFLRIRTHNTIAPENHHIITTEKIDALYRPLNAADGHNSMLKTLRNWSADRVEHDASLINQPTLIIWGEKDLVIPIKNGYKLNQLILNSRMVVFPNCGHLPHEELTDSVVDVINEFYNTKKTLEEAEKPKLEKAA
jgi:pimeloyl-ACP methyl ester carboxylesterase